MRLRTKKLGDKFRNLVATYWQPGLFYGLLIIFFGLLFWFKLGSLVGGYSPAETQALESSLSLRYIFDHPLNAPFGIMAYLIGLVYTGDQPLFPLRAASTIFALLTLTTFYWLVRHWHGERSAILGTILFGCSAWFLHTARLGTPDVLLFLLLALASGSVWLKHTDNRLVLIAGFGLAAALLYVPGMVGFLVLGALWQTKTLLRLFKKHPWFMSLGSLGMLALISPLAWTIYKTPETARALAGLPADAWPQIMEVLNRLAHIPYNLLLRGPADPGHWLGRVPILDAFSVVMLILGAYLYIRHWRLTRSKTVLAALALGTLLVGLAGTVGLSILMPFIYILVAAGIGFMLDRWHQVFPRNIIAQAIAVGLISIAVIAASWHGLRHYFVAWPSAPETKQIFIIK